MPLLPPQSPVEPQNTDPLCHRRENGIHGPLALVPDPNVHSRNLMDYCQILWRRKAMLICTIVLGTGCVFGIVKLQRPVYRATSSVLFHESPEVITLGKTDSVQDASALEASFQTQVELFQSKALLRRVFSKLNDGQWIAENSTQGTPRTRELWFVANSLKVTPTRGTRVIQIQAESHDPNIAVMFVNSIVSESIEQEHESEWKRSQSDGEWLTQQVASLRQTIEASEKNLVSYASTNSLPFTSEKDKGLDGRLLRLEDELSKAQVERFAAEARYEIVTKAPSESASEVFETGILRDYQAKMTELRRQLAEASSLWTSNHYKVKQLEAQVSVLKAAIEKERSEAIFRARNDYTSSLRREQLLSAEYISAGKAVTDQANKSIHYNLLKRDLDRDRELYDGIVQKVKQVGITSGLQPTTIHLIDAAEPPVRPQRPNVALVSYLAFICSAFLGVMAVLVRDSFSSTLQQPGDPALYLNVNELGTIPSQRVFQPRNGAAGTKLRRWPLSLASHKLNAADQRLISVELATWNQTDSLMAQCFRATLASILFSYQTGTAERIHNIVITSAAVGDGKTTVVSNLGLALARMGRKVLLIDADYKKPRLHKIFGTPGAIGLKQIINATGKITLEAAVDKTTIPGLFLLQSGADREEFPEILQSSRIAELMQAANREFDFVLIDTPPVLHLPDARIWGRLADGVILVVRAGSTDRQRAWSAVYRLAKDGVPFLGTILNDWDPRRSPAYEYSSTLAGTRQS